MKRYSQLSVDSAEKTIYNYRLCQNCIMVKAAIQMPESCWRHLLKQNDLLVKNVPTIVVVACVLHNIHMDMDAFDDSWTDGDELMIHPSQIDLRLATLVMAGETTRQVRPWPD